MKYATEDDLIKAVFNISLRLGDIYEKIEAIDTRISELAGIVERLTVCVSGVNSRVDNISSENQEV